MLPQFDLANTAAYRAWRERKLADYPQSVQDLVVEVRNPLVLSAAERAALLARCGRANMAIYACTRPPQDAKVALRALAAQLGLRTLDANYLADDDGISPITVARGSVRGEFIPYTDRAIRWHTDGYYNPPERTIRAMVLHCVQQAERGGENRLLDHELAYIALRDLDPAFVVALMQPDAMIIPARASEGEIARGDQCGPVFSFDGEGRLHMRYTARTRSIVWKQDADVLGAAQALAAILDSHPQVLRVRLEPGMGIVCNNVLHDRAAFSDSAVRRRLVLRARYYEAITAADTQSPRAAATA
ncbi:MAG: TauD/TfdA family dioxygenase [Sutterellaceae bacterium]|nr:TauD/TfdA family dioxygenase [Burkholderiaceae bacterium]MDW8430293.1 TauD/TfdA family dioxygenase [Sutterellaceae bacterium]